jgi:hypothetical protein
MLPRIVVDNASLLSLIHDRWFDLETMVFDRDARQFRLLLGDRRGGPYNEKALIMTDVSGVTVNDRARIQIYDINRLVIDEAASTIRLTSGFPMEIVITYGGDCEIRIENIRVS